jgi:hypothetical protein
LQNTLSAQLIFFFNPHKLKKEEESHTYLPRLLVMLDCKVEAALLVEE